MRRLKEMRNVNRYKLFVTTSLLLGALALLRFLNKIELVTEAIK